ncbi:hypothetical protein FisN_21Hh228 [Fistulifera solaris]|uniref:Serine incorporator 3 n=1 Tax=Fistulifera solaris TaxID=1519565 RepID=A0A1Z5JRX8_FISSO|nr:hypothetical protein FisN_21Hh228 [Fistulifera solaris]|eukprot:GAX16780.1 hypothetical protein FisN_21Hh228 [Fistulifera solaris]
MGALISSTVTMGLTYCCCNAVGSVVQSCLGGTGEGTTGRKRSVLLLSLAIAMALWFQYTVGPAIVNQSGILWKMYRWLPGMGKLTYHAWYDSCQGYNLVQCAGHAGVYRPMALSTLFFGVAAIATKNRPTLNREVWPSKFGLFFLVLLATMIVPSAPLFSVAFLRFARLGAMIFCVLQQVILIDVAYNWNEDWVDRADQADRLEYGSGNIWLHAIVASCIGLYGMSLAGIILLFTHFGDCAGNNWIISLTLVGIVAMTGIQLSGPEGSLLTSSVMSMYATYLAYSMVSKNPHAECNPMLGTNDSWGIAIGLTLTALSLAWTGFSWTAEERLNVDGVQSARPVASSNPSQAQGTNLDVPFLEPDSQVTSGLVTEQHIENESFPKDIWKLNVVMALISCWVAMTLTGWGSLESEASAANPMVGRVNMAMIGISQWFAMGLYIWTLIAPRVFPDREFS